MHRLVHPKFFMPVHGEYRHLVKHKKLAMQLGMPKENIVIAENGSVVDLTRDSIGISGKVTAGRVLIDGLGVGDVGNVSCGTAVTSLRTALLSLWLPLTPARAKYWPDRTLCPAGSSMCVRAKSCWTTPATRCAMCWVA